MKKILIADDHKIIIDGLSRILENNKKYFVGATAQHGKQAIEFMEQEYFDIAILDIEMPEKDGIEVTKWIKQNDLDTKILVLSMHNSEVFIQELLIEGVNGYILKNRGEDELITALEEISAGKTYLGSEVLVTAINAQQKAINKERRVQTFHLTKREKEVLNQLVLGKTSKEAGEALFIASTTVETHKKNLFTKTEMSNLKALIVWAMDNKDLWC